MNRHLFSAFALAVATLTAGQAVAADASAPKTREEVKAELAEAIRTGNMQADGETGQKLNELYPHRYPAATVGQAKTREQVKAELAEAVRTGDTLASGETGQKLKELFPSRYNAVN